METEYFNKIIEYFEEVSKVTTSIPRLRELFVTVVYLCDDANIELLWENLKHALSFDFISIGNSVEKSELLAKRNIERHLEICRLKLEKFRISSPVDYVGLDLSDKYRELKKFSEMVSTMNEVQNKFLNDVLFKLDQMKNGELLNGPLFIHGPAGSGKTYTFQTLCHLFRVFDIKYKTAAWIGAAAQLLPDGNTFHYTFGLPCGMSSDTAKSNNVLEELKDTVVFIIDNISVVPNSELEKIDKKLKELMDNNLPFGGKLFILGGDLKQILPIKWKANRNKLVSLSVKNSNLWKDFNKFELKDNKHVNIDEEFKTFLIKLGKIDGFIEVPERCFATRDLVEEIFGNCIGDYEEMARRIILTTSDEKATDFNNRILKCLNNGNVRTYCSSDREHITPNSVTIYLNYWSENDLPPKELTLFSNAVIILLRNLNPAIGLCTGTRLLVKEMIESHLVCEFLCGERAGTEVLVPKITFKSLKNYNIRTQFPVKLCYAVSIYKSQGQTYEKVGLDLTEDICYHGMLYTGFSRVKSWEDIKIDVENKRYNKIKNTVWKEILLDSDND